MRFMTFVQVMVVLALCFVGWGFYAGWFVMSRQDGNPQDNKVNVTLTVDGDKARADARSVEAKVQGLTKAAPEKSPQPTNQKPASKPIETLGDNQ